MLQLITVPCLADNYAFLVHDEKTGATALFDAPEAWPIQRELEARGWKLSHIFLTHHHSDHIDAAEELAAPTGAMIIGAGRDAHRLPPLDEKVEPGEWIDFSGHPVEVIDAAGHTTGHVAYYMPAARAAFTGDSLMALGCGRLFEGTPEMMWASLMRLAALPDDTAICSGHEYTAANARFALTIEPDSGPLQKRAEDTHTARAEKRPTVPSLLALEKATNPFLRANLSSLKASLGMEKATDAEVFGHIRAAKDKF